MYGNVRHDELYEKRQHYELYEKRHHERLYRRAETWGSTWEETTWRAVDCMGRKNARTCMKREVTCSPVPREMLEMYRDAWNLLCEVLVCKFKRQPYKKKRGDFVREGWRKRFIKGKPKALPGPLFGEIGKGCKDHCGEMDGGVKPGYNYMASCVVCLKWQKQIGLPILRRPPLKIRPFPWLLLFTSDIGMNHI